MGNSIQDLLFLMCFTNICELVFSCPPKRKATHAPGIDEKRVEYETEHYEDYMENKEKYEKWPEINDEETYHICQKYIKKLFAKEIPPLKYHALEIVWLLYYAERLNMRNVQLLVSAVICQLSRTQHRRRLFAFIRTPRPDCVFLINRTRFRSKKFSIALELCDYHTYFFLKFYQKDMLDEIFPRGHYARDNDPPEAIEMYERNHLYVYSSQQAEFETWPELKTKNLEDYCILFFQMLFPGRNVLGAVVYASVSVVELLYTKIKKVDGSDFEPVRNLMGLTCAIPRFKEDKFHRYIKAPKLKSTPCVFMIKKLKNETGHPSHITKYLCEPTENEREYHLLATGQRLENAHVDKGKGGHLYDFREEP